MSSCILDRWQTPLGYLPSGDLEGSVPDRLWRQALEKPVRHFLERPGKRVRADLVRIAYGLAGGEDTAPQGLVEFVELMHAGSLVVDDIEDGSELRRGQPALHHVFGLPVALNSGNWMYFSGLEHLADVRVESDRCLTMLRQALAVIRRCHEGQALDLAVSIDTLAAEEVLPMAVTISRRRTGAFTALAAWLGAMAAGADETCCDRLADFGMRLGTALQMQNDLVELRNMVAGASRWDDLANARVTWPWAWLVESADADQFQHLRGLLSAENSTESTLVDCARLLLRAVESRGRQRVRTALQEAVADLARVHRSNTWIGRLDQIITQLEKSYV